MENERAVRVSLLLLFSCMSGVAGGVCAAADQSQFVNAKVETRDASQNLESSVQQAAAESLQPVWLAYGVEAVTGNHSVCCERSWGSDHSGGCGTCNLEQERGSSFQQRGESKTVKLEGQSQLIVLLRVEKSHVMRIRIASDDCTLDAGGLRVVWLTGAKPQESVSFLTKYVNANGLDKEGSRELSEQALTAIAWHADASADRAFASFVAPSQPEPLRRKAAFWLGETRGKPGFALLQTMAKSDPSGEVRSQVSFGLFVSKEPEAVDEMIRMAREDSSTQVRGQALFWLAQKAGKKAESTITGAINNDPDTEVKRRAVFALTQMPKDEGIPKLIEVAQTNKNPEVRKQAMFWLGQSGDPRALAFFEKVLSE